MSDFDFEPVVIEFAVDHEKCSRDFARLQDELDDMRGLLADLIGAVDDSGADPRHREYIRKKHRQEWPFLWKTIDKIKKEVRR
jgi:hypothetical protein